MNKQNSVRELKIQQMIEFGFVRLVPEHFWWHIGSTYNDMASDGFRRLSTIYHFYGTMIPLQRCDSQLNINLCVDFSNSWKKRSQIIKCCITKGYYSVQNSKNDAWNFFRIKQISEENHVHRNCTVYFYVFVTTKIENFGKVTFQLNLQRRLTDTNSE